MILNSHFHSRFWNFLYRVGSSRVAGKGVHDDKEVHTAEKVKGWGT